MLSVFRKAFRDSRRTAFWLGVGLGLYALMCMSFYPSMVEQEAQINDMIRSYPDELMAAFYGDLDFETVSITEPAAFLQVYVATYTMLILGAVVMLQAFNALTNAERNGMMDIMLSLPVSRRQMLAARLLNTALVIGLALTAVCGAIVLGDLAIEEFELNLGDLLLGMYSGFFLLMAQASLTYMLAALMPSSKRWAGPVAYAIFYGSYLLYGFAGLNETIDAVKPLFLFNYYNAAEIMREGIDLVNWLVLMALIGLFSAVSVWAVDRKEFGV